MAEIIVPKTIVQGENPLFTDLAHDTGLAVSEIRSRFLQTLREQQLETLKNPAGITDVTSGDTPYAQAAKALSDELSHPEESTTEPDDEFGDIFDMDVQAPGADAFAAPIDNELAGFSDADMGMFDMPDSSEPSEALMDSPDFVDNASDVNAEPAPDAATEPTDTENAGDDMPPADSAQEPEFNF